MDNSKDYIVRYNIQTNAENAVTGLNSLSETVSAIIKPLNDIKTQLSDLYKALNSLKTIDSMKITPKLDLKDFDADLKNLVTKATATANQVNQILRGAVTGNIQAKSTASKKYKLGDFSSLEEIKTLRKSIAEEVDKLSALYGLVDSTGIKPKQVRSKVKTAEYDEAIKKSKQLTKELTQLDDIAVEFEKNQKNKTASVSGANIGPAINIETIKAWKEAFGDEKSRTLTMTLNGDASNAIKTIESVKKKLEELNPAAKFSIDPTMNLEGFAKAEQKLKSLAQLSNAVVAPFAPTNSVEKKASHKKLTGDEKRQLEEAKANLDTLNEEKRKIEKRLDKNALKYSQSPNNSLKGWVTRDTKTLEELKRKEAEYQATISRFGEKVEKPVMSAATAARQMYLDITGNISRFEVTGKVPTIMVEAKLLTDNLYASIKSIPTPTIDVNLRVNANSMLEQVMALTGGAVPGSNIESELKKRMERRRTDDDYKKWLTTDEQKQYDQAVADYNALKERIKPIRDRYNDNLFRYNNIEKKKSLLKKIDEDRSVLDRMNYNDDSFERIMKLQQKSYDNEKASLRKEIESQQKAGTPMVIDVMARFVGFVEQVTATIPANVDINKAKVLEDLKSIKIPTLQADIKLNVKGLNEQLSNALSKKNSSSVKATDIDVNRELYERLRYLRGADDIKKWLSTKQQAEFNKYDEFLDSTSYTLDSYKNLLEEAKKKYNYNKAKVHEDAINKYTKWIEKLESKRENAHAQVKKLKAISYNNEKEQAKKDIAASIPSGNIPEIVVDVKGKFTGFLNANIEPLTVDVKFSSAQVAKALELVPKQFIDLNIRFSQTQAMEALKSIQMPVIDIATRLNMDGIAEQAKQISNLQNITDKKPVKKKLTAKQIDEEVEKITPYKRTDEYSRQWLSGDDLKRFDEVSLLNKEYKVKHKEWRDAVKKEKEKLIEKYKNFPGPNSYYTSHDYAAMAMESVKDLFPDKSTFSSDYLRLRQLSIDNEKQNLRDRLTRESLEGTVKQSPVKSVIEIDAKLNTSGISKQIKEMPRLTIPLAIKLMWSGGAVGKQQQLKDITEGIKPINLQLNTATARESFDKLIAFIKANDSFIIKLDVTTSGLVKQIKELPRPNLPVAVKLMWSGGAVGRQAQLKEISGKIPPIVLKLDTGGAVHSLEEFISLVKSKSPQRIEIISDTVMRQEPPVQSAVNGAKSVVRQASRVMDDSKSIDAGEGMLNDVQTANRYSEYKEKARKLDARKRADSRFMVQKANEYNSNESNWRQYQQSLYDRLFGISKLEDDWVVKAQENRAKELAEMADDAKRAFSKPTPFEESERKLMEASALQQKKESINSIAKHQKKAERLKAQAINSVAPFVSSSEQAKELIKYRKFFKDAIFLNDLSSNEFGLADNQKKLDVLKDVRTLMEMKNTQVPWQLQNQITKLNEQVEKHRIAAKSQESANSIAKHQRKADKLRVQAMNSAVPFASSQEQMKQLVKYRKFFKNAMFLNDISIKDYASAGEIQKLNVLRDARTLMESGGVQIPTALDDNIKKIEEYMAAQSKGWMEEARKANAARAKAEAVRAKAESAESVSRHAKQAQQLRFKAYNAMLPFAENKEQVKTLVKYRKFFREAMKSSGFDVTPDMSDYEKLQYLRDVSDRMVRSNIEIPWQLQNKMNKIQKLLDKEERFAGGGGGGRGGRGIPVDQRSFFDKSRKWAFPFTGPTSFGSNTPMAVEMAKGMGAAYAIEGAMSVIGGSFGQAVDYQNIMKTTQAILQNGTDSYSNNAFEAMEKTVRNVGIKTKFSAPEVADAAKFLAMAGYDINAINNAIRPIADLALIGDSDLGETADKITNIMTTFQIAPEKMREAANIMATTAMRSNTDLMMLAESAKYGGGVANLYGRNDPNLFADTMALFGVMGNAGIQASSAGTALRMMYQNIFNPNNKQKALLEQMKKDYGITTLDKNGGYRAMSDILIDIAEKVPENKMADIVGKLFRITAQPGANAALLAAANGDENLAMANAKKIDEITNKMSTKAGISSLVSLMQANRDSVNGNISGIIADEKQNTIHGLWAQVTSTFTEAILRAFEARKDEFESMLKGLRDYFAKPETLRTIQIFLDAIIDIGKAMAWFAEVWAKMYTTAPNLIATWIKAQLLFTQIGALMSPFVSLIGVVSRLKELFINIAGYQGAQAAGGVSKYAAAILETKEKFGTPFMIPGANGKKSVKVTGGAAMRAQQEMKSNAELAAELALSGADMKDILEKLNGETRDHYAEVRRRANRRYGFARIKRAFLAGKNTTIVPYIAAILGGLKSYLIGFFSSIAKVIGMIATPIGGTIALLSFLGVAFYRLNKKISGTLEDQIVLTQKISDKFAETTELALKKTQWYQEELDKMKQKPTSFTTPEKSQQQKDYEERVEKFRGEFGDIPNMVDGLESKPGLDNAVIQYRKKVDNDILAKLALGGNYDKFVGKGLYDENKAWNPFFALFDTDRYVDPVVQKMSQASLYMAAKDDKALPSVHARLMELYDKHGDTQKFIEEANKIRDIVADKDNPIWESGKDLGPEQWNNIDDPTRFKEYHEGLWNIIDAWINGVSGTVIGKKNAYDTLKNGIPQYTPEWFENIEKIIGDVQIYFSTMNEKGKLFSNIPIKLRMDNGMIDLRNIYEQIGEGVGKNDYKNNMRDLVQVLIMAYKRIAELGGNQDTPTGALEFLNRQMQNYNVTKDDAKYFYHNFMPDWVKENNISLQRYQNMMAGDFGWIKIGDTEYNRKNEIPNMMAKLFDKMVRDYYILLKAKQATERLGEVKIPFRPDADLTIKKVHVPNSNQNTDKNDNDKNEPYKNHYRSQAPRPTQITFNINELVHFDRTTVAANAEEKHLMESMESKITEVVYKIFAEAANQAHTLAGA